LAASARSHTGSATRSAIVRCTSSTSTARTAGGSGSLSPQIAELRGDVSQFLLEIELAFLE
jgi:hypothetical protein